MLDGTTKARRGGPCRDCGVRARRLSPSGRTPATGLGLLGHVPQLLGLREGLQLLERLVLDLADALARHVERAAHLVQRAGVLPAEAIAELEDAALAVGEVLQRLAQRLLGQDLRGALVRRLGA